MKASEVTAALKYSQFAEERTQLVKSVKIAESKGHTGINRVSRKLIANIDLELEKLELKISSSYKPTNNDLQAAG